MVVDKASNSTHSTQRFKDGVVLYSSAPHTKRWQKHGEDRVCLESTRDDGGYVDLKAGKIVGLKPSHASGVRDYEMDIKDDTVIIRALPKYSLIQSQDTEPRVLAGVPTEVFG